MNNMRKIYFIWAALFALVPFTLFSQDGNPDTSFGDDGTVQTDVTGGGRDFSLAIAQQNDGKLVVAGKIETSGFDFVLALVRYNADGSLDTSFGDNGVVSKNSGNDSDQYTHLGVQSDGKIIAGGALGTFQNKILTLNRFLPNGDLDISFGANGELIPFGGNNNTTAFLLLEDDSFFVANPLTVSGQTTVMLKKYLVDGNVDMSFGVNGSIGVENGGQSDAIYFLKVMANGNIVALARAQNNGDNAYTMFRYLPDGTPDTSFGGNGAAIVSEFQEYTPRSMAVYDDGKIAVASSLFIDPDEYQNRVTRYLSNGDFDPSFGSGGAINPDVINLSVRTLLIQPNQRLLLYGELTDFFEGGGRTFIKRYGINGGLDSSFNIGTVLNFEYFAVEMILQDDGKLVCMGLSAWYNGDEDFVLERYYNTPLSVPEVETGSLAAFPNPTQNKVTLTYDLIENAEGPYQISDVSGKILAEGKLSGNQTVIDLSNLQTGLYFLNSGNSSIRLLKE